VCPPGQYGGTQLRAPARSVSRAGSGPFHRLAKGGFKSGQQWEVLRREEGQVEIEVAPGDRIRGSKNFQSAGRRFRNNELLTVTGIDEGRITVEGGEIISRGALHIDQGVCVTSHASQGKTVD